MKIASYTPAPWKAYFIEGATDMRANGWWVDTDSVVALPGQPTICKLHHRDDAAPGANARLIAASPALYEALKALVDKALGPNPDWRYVRDTDYASLTIKDFAQACQALALVEQS